MTEKADPKTILEFWKSLGQEGWFKRDDSVDQQMTGKFGELHALAAAGKLEEWRINPESCLALVILLDQFSRNMFREDGRAFATDPYAVEIARQAIADGFDAKVDPELHHFFYMPFMHSECIGDQQHCVNLFHRHGGAESLKYAVIHRDIIARFGRFPHRNPVLGRHTSPAEQAYLDGGGFGAPKKAD